ncbi:MAG: CocE/NonD family hydrolase [Coriobacteriia bacterium]
MRTDFPHPVREIENAWIPLAGGTRLAARIWLPEDAEASPVPAILEYLPYRKDDGTAAADARRHPYFAGHGYAAVRVDLRGSGDSDGLLRGEYLEQEQDDALEVLRWLAAQPWCTGDVGMIGYSWGGFNGLQVAARRPPELKAVITHASTDDRYRDDCHYMGGCLLGSDMLKWATSMLGYTLQPPDPRFVGEQWLDMWKERLASAPMLARDWVAHQRRDDFWKHGSVAEDYGAITCPVFVVGGWADAYTNAVPRLLEHLEVPRRGLIGPWGHMMPYEGVPGPAIGFLQEALRWWDRWLKGLDTGIMDEPLLRCWMQEWVPPATYYAERPGRWVGVDAWPPPGVVERPWQTHADGTLAEGTAGRDATLTLLGAQECGETAGVWCANGNADEIADDQRPDDERSMTFTSEPLQAPLEILGHPVAHLSLTADRPQAVVAVRLCDVAPDGSSLLVSWGLRNLTHDASHEQARALEPVDERAYEIGLRVCGHRFDAGHRLRLAVSPTYWPHAWPSAESVTLGVVAGASSTLTLPVLAKGAAEVPVDEFGPPEVAAWSAEDPAPIDRRARTVSVRARGLHSIDDVETHERTVRPGVRHRELARDTYLIREGDPLSAEVFCTRETISAGGPHPWAVRLRSTMSADQTDFLITEEYEALAGEQEIMRNARTFRIPRDHV